MVAGCKFLPVKAVVIASTCNSAAMAGDLSLAQFKKQYTHKDGFMVKFSGTSVSHAFFWRDFYDHKESLYLFDPPMIRDTSGGT
mmetsp:Transcript_33577/g.71603  ORF Transcript_33577/g.71603 Transcript_33577/m.71603 type:complete len:84 (+) Transcript_33577:428-679(+)